ncbi:MAG: hypothetical protein ACREIS_01410 [Nitrospiraceae bacterium]
MKMDRGWREALRRNSWLIGAVITGLVLIGPSTPSAMDPCEIAAEQGGIQFPVEQLDSSARCQIGLVVNDSSTSDVVGPIETPIPLELYGFLVDHPIITASLVQSLGLAAYQFTGRGHHQYWVNDGEGTQALLSLVYQGQTTRIYHLVGYHEGRVFPLVRAKAAVFLRMLPVVTPDGRLAVENTLISYTRLDDPWLAGVVRLLRPLIGGAVTRKLSRGFEVTNQLGTLIAKDPDRVVQQVGGLPQMEPEVMRTLAALLQASRRPTTPLESTVPSP